LSSLSTVGILGWISCWMPLGDSTHWAPTGITREHGAAGSSEAFAVQRRGRYAIVWAQEGVLTGGRGSAVANNRREPMLDRATVQRVVRWGTKAAAETALRAGGV
jgi:hypothetical protein